MTRISFIALRDTGRRIVSRLGIDADVIKRFGLLSQHIQVRAAIVLADVHHRGIGLDASRRKNTEERLRQEMARLVQNIHEIPGTGGVFKTYKRSGKLQYTTNGKPRTDAKRFTELLSAIADEHELVVPLTPKEQKPSLARSFWEQHTELDPFIDAWVQLDETSKLAQFFAGLQENRIHPRYTTLVRTGRTSCQKPNIQQIPRSGQFREMFIPSPGHLFFTIDYAALELRTLAAECEQRFGGATLADVIRDGVDPHCYTASLLLGMDTDEFLSLEHENRSLFKTARQQAKAVNFGVLGGLGARSLSNYAKLAYGLNLSESDAAKFRDRLLYEIYPEIGEYMESDMATILPQNLKTSLHKIRQEFPSDGLLRGARSIVQGRKTKRDGSDYDPDFVEGVWYRLETLNCNPNLDEMIINREVGEGLERRLFFGTVTTATGRVRGRATFTQRKNTPFQGMAADGTKIALWNLYKTGYRIVAFVHDEFVIELPLDADHKKSGYFNAR